MGLWPGRAMLPRCHVSDPCFTTPNPRRAFEIHPVLLLLSSAALLPPSVLGRMRCGLLDCWGQDWRWDGYSELAELF